MEAPSRPDAAFSQAMLDALSDAGVGVLVVESQRIVFANRAVADMTGYGEAELLALPSYAELIAPADRELVAANQRRRLAGEAVPPRYDLRALRRDGSEIVVEIAVAVIPGGRGAALLSTIVDVTARKHAETELLTSESQFRALADAHFEGVVIHDQGRVLLVNQRLAELLGYDMARIRTMNVIDVVPPRLVPEILPRLTNGEAEVRYETLVRHADGSEIPVEIMARPTTYQGRRVRIAAVRDIRPWRRAEAELIASRDEAVRARQAESLFFANMSHELRTPLHAVIGFATLGLEHCPPDRPDLARYFERIRASGERQLGLVNDLLDLVRLEAGQATPRADRADLGELARTVADELAPLWSASGLHMILDIPAGDLRAEVDRDRIAQVLRNLLSNAIKFSPPGGTVIVALREAGADQLRLAVSDEGPGIPEAELDAIFEKFTQSSRTRSGAGGTGLGLAICREILALHGGRIRAVNRPDGGALFDCLLPRRSPRDVTGEAP